MITAILQHPTLFRLKNLIQQIRFPWSCYAVFGAVLGTCTQNLALALAISLLFLPTIFCLNQKFKCASIVLFLASLLITTGVYDYQSQKIINFYADYAQLKFTIKGEIVDIDSLALNPKLRAVRILVHQLSPVIADNNMPKFVTMRVSGTNQLQLHDQIILRNLVIPEKQHLALIRANLREQALLIKLTPSSTYTILARLESTKFNPFVNPTINFMKQKIYNFKHKFLSQLKFKLAPTTFNLLATVFLGHKRAGTPSETQQIRDQFQVWGLAHFLARAGLHMIIIALLIKLLLLALQVPARLTSPAIMVIALLYHQLSWPSVSFLRALYMVILYESCKLFNLQIDGLHLLNLIFISALIMNPAQIFFLDFQLSFALTYALVLAFRQNQYQIIAPHIPTSI